MPNIAFASNYTDLSSERGFQFKFFCGKCGNGYMSTFESNKVGAAASAVNLAASLFGGIFGGWPNGALDPKYVAGPQHDSCLGCGGAGDQPALQAMHPLWSVGLRARVLEPESRICETCAPESRREIAAAQANAAKQQVTERCGTSTTRTARPGASRRPTLSQLRRKTQGGKFCPGVRHQHQPETEMRALRRRSRRHTKVLPRMRKGIQELA
jgi:hypothetical protein